MKKADEFERDLGMPKRRLIPGCLVIAVAYGLLIVGIILVAIKLLF